MISVLIPVRDGERYLDEAITSILNQTYGDFELIVIDDGSADRSPEIASAAATRDPRVKVVRLTPDGVSAALNAGLELAGRPWIARMDADDVALPHRFERQLFFARQRPNVVAWSTWAHAIDDNGRVLSLMASGPTTLADFERQHRSGSLRPIHSTMIVRRDAVRDVGGYDVAFPRAQDIELWDRLGEIGPILTVPEPLLLVRVHAASRTTTMFEETVRVHRFVAARRASIQAGRRLTWDDFVATERNDPVLRRAARRRDVRAAMLRRRAGVRYAERRYAAAVANIAFAALLAPHVTMGRAWRQVLGPRLTGRLGSSDVAEESHDGS